MNQEQKIISSVCIHETHDWTVQQSGAQVSQVVRNGTSIYRTLEQVVLLFILRLCKFCWNTSSLQFY